MRLRTIHRLLEVNVNPEDKEAVGGFMRNRQNPLETDVIIIDEMSMVDLPLMHALLSAVVPGTKARACGGCRSASLRGTWQSAQGHYFFRMFPCGDADADFPSGRRERYCDECP